MTTLVIPWGRFVPLRPNLLKATKPEREGVMGTLRSSGSEMRSKSRTNFYSYLPSLVYWCEAFGGWHVHNLGGGSQRRTDGQLKSYEDHACDLYTHALHLLLECKIAEDVPRKVISAVL